MEKYCLNGAWQFRMLQADRWNREVGRGYPVPEDWISAKVPGSMYQAYLEAGVIEDPYYRDNELKTLPLSECDYEYKKIFTVTGEQLANEVIMLSFEGIDTLGQIFLNDRLLGETSNMHLCYQYHVKNLLREGENTLRVVLHSPVKYIKEENRKTYTGGSHDAMEGYPHLRKAHCMFGWDWGPRLPDLGIFRDVNLLFYAGARLLNVSVRQGHMFQEGSRQPGEIPERVILKINWEVQTERPAYSGSCHISVIAPDGQTVLSEASKKQTASGKCRESIELESMELEISDPQLWWPNGYGRQPLYTVRLELTGEDASTVEDVWERKIGLRTLSVDTRKDAWGEKFAHQVNGLDIFAMGSNYIPEDNLFGRLSRERTKKLLEDCVAANHNMIRVWGGGYYPDDYFYDICDELGLIVWQDLMFSCSAYELDEAFENTIREEISQNIRRIRHHASLGIWCGNNEMEAQTIEGSWNPSVKQKADYIKMFDYLIPKIVKQEDPQTFYWPSSPSSGGNFDDPWDENRGDTHYWSVWHGDKPFTDYRNYHFRYLSEFGFQSFPCRKTVESFTGPEDRNIFSRVMEMHQRNCAANGKIMNYLSQTFLYPADFDRLLYASQLLQMEAIRYGVEHFRRHRGRCMGTVVWQLNDIWPVASWASIDYFGRWKALHYAEARMFAPVMISCEETGELTERPFCIMERTKPVRLSAKLHVANETWETVHGKVYWELRRPDASVILQGGEEISIEPFSGRWLAELDFSGQDELDCYLSYRFVQEDRILSEGSSLFTAPKHFHFIDPGLSLIAEGDWLTVTAKGYARSVEIIALDGDVRLSDNYFDMHGGSRRIKIVSGRAAQFALRSVYDIGGE